MGVVQEPIMGYTVINPEYHAKPSTRVKCTLYEARKPSVLNNDGVEELG